MNQLRAFLVDDEPLALKRLSRLLADTGRVEVIGSSSIQWKPLSGCNLSLAMSFSPIFRCPTFRASKC
jgi:DNA-binding NarL/FixJ family response regulator